MKSIEVLKKIKSLNQPIFRTNDIEACLSINRAAASKLLARLESFGHLIHLSRGLWALIDKVDPLMLPEYLTAPSPSYISLQSALFYHGMISQIPDIIYAVSLARTRQFKTPIGIISIHHIQPEFFLGFESHGKYGIKIAVPEKALLDVIYLSTAKTGLFSNLPEWELPKNFSFKKAWQLIKHIKSANRRIFVEKRFTALTKIIKRT